MTSLLFAPKKVFRSIYYHVCPRCQSQRIDADPGPETYASSFESRRKLPRLTSPRRTETKNTWHRPDPSFTYLLAFFMLLTGLAWGVATTYHAAGIVRLTLLYVFAHFLLLSLAVATLAYFFVGRLLGPGIAGLPGRRRQQGLFIAPQDRDQLEFGYCFDVRASIPPQRWSQLLLTRVVTGLNSSILPSLGFSIRAAVYTMASDIERLLVGPIAHKDACADFEGSRCSSGIPCTLLV